MAVNKDQCCKGLFSRKHEAYSDVCSCQRKFIVFILKLATKFSQNITADRRGAYHIVRRPVAELPKVSINVHKLHLLSARHTSKNGFHN